MPISKNMSHDQKVAELMRTYNKTGKIGSTVPKDKKHALEIANAIAYNMEETYKPKMNIEEILDGLNNYISERNAELTILEDNSTIIIDSSLHKGEEGKYYQENLQGKIVTHPVLGDIHLGKKGRRETIYKSPSKYMGILCYIDKIIQGGYSNGLADEPKHPRNDSITGFYYIYDEVLYDGIPLGVTVEICEDSRGRKYYMFKAYTNEKYYQNTGVLLDEQEANHGGSTSIKSISDIKQKVKPGDKFMLGDFIEITVLDTFKKDKNEIFENPKVKVTLDNGETFETEVDPKTSEDDLKKQYAIGSEINVGRAGQERKARIKSATLTKSVGEGLEPVEIDLCYDCIDVIAMDVPLFIRMLEWAREEAKSDIELHKVTENAVALMKNDTEFLAMADYENIIKQSELEETNVSDMGIDPINLIKRKNKFIRKRKNNEYSFNFKKE